ncbi:MAG: radical SAM protein [Nanoarchaeota archaeon]
MKVLLIYPPFCPPTVRPYSISYLKGFVLANLEVDVKCLDLNAKYHKKMFPKFYERLERVDGRDANQYGKLLGEFLEEARPTYSINNKKVVCGEKPDLADEMLDIVLREKPDLVAMSLVYSSQCFHAMVLADELAKIGIKCVAGGPAVNPQLAAKCPCLKNEVELYEQIAKIAGEQSRKNTTSELDCWVVPDYSDYDDPDYFAAETVIPLKSSSTCFYKQCAFCTHFRKAPYLEVDIELIKEAIVRSGAKNFFFIDDTIPRERLLALASALKPLKVKWWAQLRPTRDMLGTFDELAAAGLKAICWGVESGSQRILDLMEKGTKVEDISEVLRQSHAAGIKNTTYIMFGFPTETKGEFMETLNFLKSNSESLFIVSTTVFGLQKGSKAYENPSQYGITEITEEKRELLDERLTYKTASGMTKEEAKEMRQRFIKSIRKLNKAPIAFKDYKEQVLLLQ